MLSLPEPDRAKFAQELLRSLEDDREAPPALDDATLEAELDWSPSATSPTSPAPRGAGEASVPR